MKLFAFLWLAAYMICLAGHCINGTMRFFHSWGYVGIAFVIALLLYAVVWVNQRILRRIRIDQLKGLE